MMYRIRLLLLDEEGATMVEYGLLAMLIGAICVLAVSLIGEKTNDAFGGVEAQSPWPE